MKKLLSIAPILAILFVASTLSFAQVPSSQANKIVIINTSAFFDEKTGITKIVAARKQVNTELAPKRNDVMGMVSRTQALEKEIATMRDNVQKNIPIDQRAAEAKIAELERLKREGKFKGDEFNALVQKRQNEVVGAQFEAAIKALGEFIKSKGYGMVFDIAKDQAGFLVFATEQNDITREFIALYNSRPAATAAANPR